MRFHWQNLNDDRNGNPRGWAHEGRAWWRFDWVCFQFSWNLWTHFAHIYLNVDPNERDVTVAVAFPPFAFWFSVENLNFLSRFWKGMRDEREIGLTFHDGAVWWGMWKKTMSWSRGTPKWQDGNFNFADAFLGQTKYSETAGRSLNTVVSMPEGNYPVLVRMYEATWVRPRSPFKTRINRIEVKPTIPIPFPGKGENSWDCGDDALWGMTCNGDNVEDGIAAVVRSVIASRRKHGSLDRIWAGPKPKGIQERAHLESLAKEGT